VTDKRDVICVGAAVVDIPLRPVHKEMFEIESYPLESIEMVIGGDALNESIIINRLGHKTALVAMVGEDAPAACIQDACDKEGVCRQGLKINPNVSTSLNIGLVTEDGERTFITNRNGSLWKTTFDDLNLNGFSDARLLSLASIFNNPLLDCDALMKIFKMAKDNKLIICADMIKPRLGETLIDIKPALSYLDYFFPNYEEASLLSGKTSLEEIANTFLECGVKCVVIKNGKNGCYIKRGAEIIEVPAIPNIQAFDTIGAGDNFVSGFIAAILEGKSLEECGRFANATASIAVESAGATSGVRNRQIVEERYELYTRRNINEKN